MSAPIVFLDTETTSLRDDRRPWEIAMIRRDETGEHEVRIFVANVDIAEADPFALDVGGYYDRHPSVKGFATQHVQPAPKDFPEDEWDAADTVEQWTRGAYLIASNPAFDAATLAAMLKRHEMIPAWSYHLIDVRAMAIGWLSSLNYTPDAVSVAAKSDDLARACGIDTGDYERHTAMGDARMVRDWFDAMTGGVA